MVLKQNSANNHQIHMQKTMFRVQQTSRPPIRAAATECCHPLRKNPAGRSTPPLGGHGVAAPASECTGLALPTARRLDKLTYGLSVVENRRKYVVDRPVIYHVTNPTHTAFPCPNLRSDSHRLFEFGPFRASIHPRTHQVEAQAWETASRDLSAVNSDPCCFGRHRTCMQHVSLFAVRKRW